MFPRVAGFKRGGDITEGDITEVRVYPILVLACCGDVALRTRHFCKMNEPQCVAVCRM